MTGLSAEISVRHQTKPGSQDFTLDVAISVPAGSTVALLGPNGAGKTTTVEVLAGIRPNEQGRIELDGRTIEDPETGVYVPAWQRRIGVVFQDYLLFEHLDVIDNIAFGVRASGRSPSKARTEARRWLEAMELVGLGDRRPSQLSGGQAQRVSLARALAIEPELLLLDEPLAALDVETRTRLRRTLRQHLDEFAGARLLITHDPTDAFLLADTIVVVEAGRVTQSGSPAEIRRRPATKYAAALSGTNLLTGSNRNGMLTLDEHSQTLQTADTRTNGSVLITVHPTAIALHPSRPDGSPRNTWETSVATVEPLGETTRITLAGPLPLGVDITPGATAALGLAPGSPVWASVKATEIGVNPA